MLLASRRFIRKSFQQLMKPVRLICVGMPVLLVCLVWMNRRPVESQYKEGEAVQQIQKERHFEKNDVVWEAPGEFQDWLKAYRKSDDRIDLDEGLTLARERRVTMKHLIKTNPREALERAIPDEERVGLPEETVSYTHLTLPTIYSV